MEEFENLFVANIIKQPSIIADISDKFKPEYIFNDYVKKIYSYMLEHQDFNLMKMAKDLNIKPTELLKIESSLMFVKKDELFFICYTLLENYKTVKMREALDNGDKKLLKVVIEDLKDLSFDNDDNYDESEEFIKAEEDIVAGRPDLRLIKTGFNTIDDIIGGVRKSELIVIGARPAAGKTTLGLNIACNIAKEKKNVLFFSIEMSKFEMHKKLVRSLTETTRTTEENFNKVIKSSKYIKEKFTLKINDKAGISVEELIYKSKIEKEKNGVDLIVVDHIGILTSNKSFKSRYELITYVSFQLKILAKELDVPVIALCQLSRGVEQRELKAPNMADLRDSGSIEQDADLICFIHNPEYYLKQREPDDKSSKEWDKWSEQMDKFKDKAQFVIVKNRRGVSGTAKLRTRFNINKFFDRYED